MSKGINTKNIKNEFIEILQGKILSGELKPGDKLPPERELAQAYGFSRGSVNQGILDLERMGFLRVIPRKGSFITEYLSNGTPETLSAIMSYDSTLLDSALFRDLMNMRILVERECVRLACSRLSSYSREIISTSLNDIYKSDDKKRADAVYRFHLNIVKLSENSAYIMVFRSFEKMLKNMIGVHYSCDAEYRKALPMYDKLAAALIQGDIPIADKYIVAILESGSAYFNLLLAE